MNDEERAKQFVLELHDEYLDNDVRNLTKQFAEVRAEEALANVDFNLLRNALSWFEAHDKGHMIPSWVSTARSRIDTIHLGHMGAAYRSK